MFMPHSRLPGSHYRHNHCNQFIQCFSKMFYAYLSIMHICVYVDIHVDKYIVTFTRVEVYYIDCSTSWFFHLNFLSDIYFKNCFPINSHITLTFYFSFLYGWGWLPFHMLQTICVCFLWIVSKFFINFSIGLMAFYNKFVRGLFILRNWAHYHMCWNICSQLIICLSTLYGIFFCAEKLLCHHIH